MKLYFWFEQFLGTSTQPDHVKAANAEAAVFGYRFTNGFEINNGLIRDFDVLDGENRYITTLRKTQHSDGTYSFKEFVWAGVSVGEKIDPDWQGFKNGAKEQDEFERQYWEKNR